MIEAPVIGRGLCFAKRFDGALSFGWMRVIEKSFVAVPL